VIPNHVGSALAEAKSATVAATWNTQTGSRLLGANLRIYLEVGSVANWPLRPECARGSSRM